jgi:hypothetical protein
LPEEPVVPAALHLPKHGLAHQVEDLLEMVATELLTLLLPQTPAANHF